jgi:hypothetical protein
MYMFISVATKCPIHTTSIYKESGKYVESRDFTPCPTQQMFSGQYFPGCYWWNIVRLRHH